MELLEGKLGQGDIIEAYLDGETVKYRKTGSFEIPKSENTTDDPVKA